MSTHEQDINIEQYEFEPIKGYPMLNWKGKRPFRSTQYYPAQLKETHGEAVEGWLNKIFWGDNIQVMSHMLKEYRGKVKLVYIDPPFDSKADYKKKITLKGKNVSNDHNSFEEKQYTDIWISDGYLQYIFERIVLIRELLSDDGSLYVHCDSRKSHYIRCILDEVFGMDNFRNEIKWKRQPVRGAKARSKQYARNSDTIIFYSKSNNWTWNGAYKPYDEKFIKTKFRPDENGRLFRDCDLGDYSEESIKKFEEQGKIYITSGRKKRLKRYLDEEKGESLGDIWIDIPEVNSQAAERTNYPTQKPEALIERIIKASSAPGDIIFDGFMGSGTTQVVAMKLGRRFLGADINLGAVQTTTKRLVKMLNNYEEELSGFEVYNVNNYEVFRNPVQAKELLIEALEVQPIYNNSLYDGEKDGRMVKVMPVNRIATRADLNELITNFDYKLFEKRQQESPNQPVERLLLVCMGHEPDLAAALEQEIGYKIDIEVVDILRDKTNLEFKRDSEAEIIVKDDKLVIKNFYPMNLLQKLSIMKENVEDWKELVESVMIDWNYDGAVLEPAVVDIPERNELVTGEYKVPEDAGTIRVKITDLLSESLEVTIDG
ncbi:DNA methyltransferase [Pseudobacillus sp. 179-B 2D1 NHS]|uniref:DNA methyltransferase n=1 Tax=Pseudobacillus sp. 179-B 2D1 NHS TaxID=3374292 RepID=UPI00387A0991